MARAIGPRKIGKYPIEFKAKAASCGFYIEVEDVHAVHESIRECTHVEWGSEVYHYGRRESAIRDPDGYMIIFTEETDGPPTCPDE